MVIPVKPTRHRSWGKAMKALRYFLTVLFFAVPWPSPGFSQSTSWEQYTAAGTRAYQQGQYAEGEKLFLAALKEAEGFGQQDPRLAASLNNLAGLYRAQRKYAAAEPLYKRSLAIREKALGPDHPNVATSLEYIAVLYQKTGREKAAEKLEKRAAAIRAIKR